MPPAFREKAALAVADHFISLPLFQQSQHIACYVAYRNEIDCLPLIQAIWRADKECYLPVVDEGKTLKFALYREEDVLQPNKFGILEPSSFAERIAPEKLDVVVTPLIAFDRQGHRLGTGGGYYDRTFAALRDQVQLVGVAYSAQEAALLPGDSWDVKLRGVVTEKALMVF